MRAATTSPPPLSLPSCSFPSPYFPPPNLHLCLLSLSTKIMGFSSNPVSGEESNPQNQKIEQLKCPRCNSTSTKFCYFNNYSRSQPRHFCKSCKRHWTAGGTLRNVPVGGCRKANRRPKSSSRANASIGQNIDLVQPPSLPEFINSGEDFGLSFPLLLNLMGPEEVLQPQDLEFSSSSSASSGCWGSCWDDLSGLFFHDDVTAGVSSERPSLG